MERTYDDSMFIDEFEHGYTWSNGFLRNVRRFSQRTAVLDPETNRSWTYESLNKEANRLADALKKNGVKKNDVVMCALRNSPEFCFCYTGPRKIGAILLAANYNLASGELALLIEHNKPKIIIYSGNIANVVAEAEKFSKHKVQKYILADNIENEPLPEGHIRYEDFVLGADSGEPQIDFRPHIYDEVLRLCTSGTTALPKSVPVNDINEVLSAHDVIMHYPLTQNDITLNMTPWFHRGGCHSGGPCPVFYVGGAVVLMRVFMPQKVLEWCEEFNITFITGVPANLEMLARCQETAPQKLSALKGLVTMGSPLTKESCIRFSKLLTPNIFNGYGTTETFWNSFLRPYDLPDGAGSVGTSSTDDEVRLVQIFDDRKASPDEMVAHDGKTIGEVIIHAPEKTTCTYYENPEQTAEKFHDGWMYTGDTGTWDENWIVTVLGRKDDMINVSGENIYPTQIEEVINQCPKVKDSLVTCVSNEIRGQAVVAYVVPEDPSLTILEVKRFCNKNKTLSQYKRPRYYALVPELPKTATGKKKRSEIRERAEKDFENGILLR